MFIARIGISTVLLAGSLVACTTVQPAVPSATPERTPPLEDAVFEYVATWGGDPSQYQVILTADCESATNLLNSAIANAAGDPVESPQWRAHTGYANAANDRILALNC